MSAMSASRNAASASRHRPATSARSRHSNQQCRSAKTVQPHARRASAATAQSSASPLAPRSSAAASMSRSVRSCATRDRDRARSPAAAQRVFSNSSASTGRARSSSARATRQGRRVARSTASAASHRAAPSAAAPTASRCAAARRAKRGRRRRRGRRCALHASTAPTKRGSAPGASARCTSHSSSKMAWHGSAAAPRHKKSIDAKSPSSAAVTSQPRARQSSCASASPRMDGDAAARWRATAIASRRGSHDLTRRQTSPFRMSTVASASAGASTTAPAAGRRGPATRSAQPSPRAPKMPTCDSAAPAMRHKPHRRSRRLDDATSLGFAVLPQGASSSEAPSLILRHRRRTTSLSTVHDRQPVVSCRQASGAADVASRPLRAPSDRLACAADAGSRRRATRCCGAAASASSREWTHTKNASSPSPASSAPKSRPPAAPSCARRRRQTTAQSVVVTAASSQGMASSTGGTSVVVAAVSVGDSRVMLCAPTPRTNSMSPTTSKSAACGAARRGVVRPVAKERCATLCVAVVDVTSQAVSASPPARTRDGVASLTLTPKPNCSAAPPSPATARRRAQTPPPAASTQKMRPRPSHAAAKTGCASSSAFASKGCRPTSYACVSSTRLQGRADSLESLQGLSWEGALISSAHASDHEAVRGETRRQRTLIAPKLCHRSLRPQRQSRSVPSGSTTTSASDRASPASGASATVAGRRRPWCTARSRPGSRGAARPAAKRRTKRAAASRLRRPRGAGAAAGARPTAAPWTTTVQ
ncbi:hypothetical protein M885DRAFT_537078 [Pelagophyceae sp. CCMP2097]|nr:hypothetical protein M885DRAFT_537078 [Pelagophyceae sp. CCMP2097]